MRLSNMTDDPADSSPLLFTTHRTVIYVDPASGELRHGPHGTSAPNARLVFEGGQGRIVYVTDRGERPIVCTADRSQVSIDGALDAATLFDIVHLRQRWITLKARGLFLCAKDDGTVAL